MAKDLTVIYLTASEIKEEFAKFQRETLLKAMGDYPLISVSRKPLDFGTNILDEEPRSLSNIYRQMLRACKVATTPFIAIAEDDTLYHETHFNFHRPALDTFAYDQNRMALFTWGTPMYHWRNRISNCSLIAPRELLIEALEERFAKYPQGTPEDLTGEVGRGRIARGLGLKEYKCEEVYNKYSLIQVNHANASEERQRTKRKSYGPIKAYDIPIWGRADELVKKYK